MKVCPTTAQLQSHVAPDFFRLLDYVSAMLLRSRVEGELDLAACEREIQRLLCAIGAGLVRLLMQSQDCEAREVEWNGVRHKCVLRSQKQFLTRFGVVQVVQHLFRPPGRNRATVSILEQRLKVVKGYFTPGAASLALRLVADCTLRDASDFCHEVGMGVSPSSLHRLLQETGRHWESNREVYEGLVREQYEVSAEAVTVCASMDGVMAPLRRVSNVKGDSVKEANPDDIGEVGNGEVGGLETPLPLPRKASKAAKSRYRELGCGTVATYNKDGERLNTVYYGRMPDERKATLTSQILAELRSVRHQCPHLRRVYLCDGADVNWRRMDMIEKQLRAEEAQCGDSSPESICILDYYHACEHLKRAADAIFGEGTDQARTWFKERKFWLRHFDDGARQVLGSLRHYLGRARGPHRKKIKEEVTYFTNQLDRMDYKLYERLNLPIGSGVIEAACKTLVTQRMKRSGMLWSVRGGQATLNLRAWIKSGRFETAFPVLIQAQGHGHNSSFAST